MATRLITEGDFRASRYGQLADQIEGRLSDLIEAAESYIESYVDRRLSRETYTEIAQKGRRSVFLRETPLITVDKVEFKRDDTWTEITDYEVSHAIGVIEFDADIPQDVRVRVTYEAGYEPIPAIIKTAVILQTAYFAYQDFEIYGSGDSKEPGIRYIQDEVEKYMRAFVRQRLV